MNPPDHDPELPLDPDAPDERVRPLHLTIRAVALVFVGGALGTALRYAIGQQLTPSGTHAWPVGTFVANVVGAFVLGALLEALARAGADTGWRQHLRLLLGTGFCGGLTTYSTFAVESDLLVHHGASATAAGYVLATLFAGLAATVTGIVVAGVHHRQRLDQQRLDRRGGAG